MAGYARPCRQGQLARKRLVWCYILSASKAGSMARLHKCMRDRAPVRHGQPGSRRSVGPAITTLGMGWSEGHERCAKMRKDREGIFKVLEANRETLRRLGVKRLETHPESPPWKVGYQEFWKISTEKSPRGLDKPCYLC